MTDEREDEPERGRSSGVEGQKRMSSTAGKQSPGLVALEATANQRGDTAQTEEAEVRHSERMAWDADGLEELLEQRVGVSEERAHQPCPRGGISPQRCAGRGDRLVQHRRGPVVEGMRQGRRRLHPRQAKLLERQSAQKRRHHGHGVDCRADVVVKTWAR